jgi:hypothetical protein
VAGTMRNAEARRRTLQGYEVDARIDWLKDHIRRLNEQKNFALVIDAWKRELIEKLRLKLELIQGHNVSDSEVKSYTNVVRILGRTREWRETATYKTSGKVSL